VRWPVRGRPGTAGTCARSRRERPARDPGGGEMTSWAKRPAGRVGSPGVPGGCRVARGIPQCQHGSHGNGANVLKRNVHGGPPQRSPAARGRREVEGTNAVKYPRPAQAAPSDSFGCLRDGIVAGCRERGFALGFGSDWIATRARPEQQANRFRRSCDGSVAEEGARMRCENMK
jgi:hypothetical protein